VRKYGLRRRFDAQSIRRQESDDERDSVEPKTRHLCDETFLLVLWEGREENEGVRRHANVRRSGGDTDAPARRSASQARNRGLRRLEGEELPTRGGACGDGVDAQRRSAVDMQSKWGRSRWCVDAGRARWDETPLGGKEEEGE
jgi:hypothetical protein